MVVTLPLALEDFVPVILTLVAYIFITRPLLKIDKRCGFIAIAGYVLIIAGGLFKAVSKLDFQLTGYMIPWMDEGQFHFMAPGFLIFAWAAWNAYRVDHKQRNMFLPWQVPVIMVVLFGGFYLFVDQAAHGQTVFFILLTLTTLGSIALLISLAMLSWKRGQKFTAILFLFYMVFHIGLQGMAVNLEHTLANEWSKQIFNTIATLVFVFASWRFSTHIKQENE